MAQAGQGTAGAKSTPPATQTTQTTTEAKTDADRIRELEAENARLREQLAAAGQAAPAAKPTEPSFVFSEGQRDELERTGRTVSPFTGALQVGSGKPGEKPREASADEFAKAKPAEKK